MGRPQTWTEPELLAAVMGLFRRRGFAGTSVKDIGEATGVHPGSLYKAYGSKEGLFTAALAAYTERIVRSRIREYLDGPADPVAGIREFFTTTFTVGDEPNPGCLLTNTAVEAYLLPAGPRDGVAGGLALIEQGLLGAVDRARGAGLIAATASAADLAVQLLAFYQGLLVLVRFGTPRDRLAVVVDRTITAVLQPIKGDHV